MVLRTTRINMLQIYCYTREDWIKDDISSKYYTIVIPRPWLWVDNEAVLYLVEWINNPQFHHNQVDVLVTFGNMWRHSHDRKPGNNVHAPMVNKNNSQ